MSILISDLLKNFLKLNNMNKEHNALFHHEEENNFKLFKIFERYNLSEASNNIVVDSFFDGQSFVKPMTLDANIEFYINITSSNKDKFLEEMNLTEDYCKNYHKPCSEIPVISKKFEFLLYLYINPTLLITFNNYFNYAKNNFDNDTFNIIERYVEYKQSFFFTNKRNLKLASNYFKYYVLLRNTSFEIFEDYKSFTLRQNEVSS
jgi:hypothetical protein